MGGTKRGRPGLPHLAALLLIAVLSGCASRAQQAATPAATDLWTAPLQLQSDRVTVYFADPGGEGLRPVTRPVPAGSEPVQVAVMAVIAGPEAGEGALATMPPGTRLWGLVIEGGDAHVNLSREFRDNHPGGTAGELLTLYSLTNTLTEFADIGRVYYWLQGEPMAAYLHMDLSEGLLRREDLIAPP